ncbi:MAG: SpoIID/LytB domain-containing protein [Deltaproteobacteria bacterium]|nr:SpoIID/LytB domain-containing protein [Deltaproteobacteria bacterium]
MPVVLVLRLALLAAMLVAGAARAGAQSFSSTFVARWNLSHGKYLVDIGQYLEAMEAFDTAIEMASAVEVRTEAWLQKAAVLSLFLDAPEDAIRLYDELVAQYPSSSDAEAALFRAAMVLFDRGQYQRAAQYFERYLKRYPQGQSRASAEFLLQQSRTKVAVTPPPAVAPPSITEVRVRVLKGHSNVRIDSDGGLVLTPPTAGSPAGRVVDLSVRSGLVSVGGRAGVQEVTISGSDPSKPLAVRAGRTTRHYHGRLSVRCAGNVLLLVNHAGIEEYLYGVVTKESGASWPAEALKAQAIASRSYALYQAQHRRERDYDMVDDEGSQVYGGVEGETKASRRAVDDTRAQALAHGGRPIYAMFTANAGWHTGDPKIIFNQPLPYLVATPDPYSPEEQLGRWTRRHSAAEVRRALAEVLREPLGEIRDIRPVLTCPSGRIVRVAIVDDRGAHEMRTRPTLGRALNLPDILLNVRREGDHFVFAGGGFGHGVGLSQWGAKNMADKGFSAKDILAFYYRGAEIRTFE